MNPPSEEQKIIIDLLSQQNNIIVDACAGSGKSTTILSSAIQYSSWKFIQLTYNSLLKEEIKEKVKELGLTNISVNTFHSLAVKYYYREAFDDAGIRRILREKMPPKIELPHFDVLVLDEAQDMTPLLFEFIVKFTLDTAKPFQLFVLGDKRQGLYQFKGSYTGYLTLADKMWENHPFLRKKEFVFCTLQTSYRITCPMADFMNKVMLGEMRIIACKPGFPVKYVRRENYILSAFVISNIKRIMAEKNASYGDFFILAGSLKTYEIRKIENELVQAGIPCYISMMENRDQLDSRVIDNKVVFSSFHAVKGRERRFVFVVGFDSSYLKSYENEYSIYDCPNTLYVGGSRATEGLFLLENEHYRPLPFLKMTHSEMQKEPFVDFIGNPVSMVAVQEKREKTEKIKRVTPTQMIQFLSEDLLEIITPILDEIYSPLSLFLNGVENEEEINEEKDDNILEIPSILQTKTGFEEISDLNGNVLPIMFYDHILSSSSFSQNKTLNQNYKRVFQNLILSEVQYFKPKQHTFLKEIVQNMPEKCETAADYLYLANIHLAIEEKLYSKIKQIDSDEYNWLSEDIIQECYHRLETVLGEDTNNIGEWTPEKILIHSSANEDHVEIDNCLISHLGDEFLFRFTARIDLLTENTIWEWKCTSKLTVEHKIQLVIYAWIWKMLYPTDHEKSFRLFNMKTGELLELNANENMEKITKIVVEILKKKYLNRNKKIEKDYLLEANALFVQ
jgi:hypothetical protein